MQQACFELKSEWIERTILKLPFEVYTSAISILTMSYANLSSKNFLCFWWMVAKTLPGF
jgi:hypothetical protein